MANTAAHNIVNNDRFEIARDMRSLGDLQISWWNAARRH
jgi:hypothetical protein